MSDANDFVHATKGIVVETSETDDRCRFVIGEALVTIDRETRLIRNVQLENESNENALKIPENAIKCAYLLPGFIDIHSHSRGVALKVEDEFNTKESAIESLKIAANEGCTSIVASITLGDEDLKKNDDNVSSIDKRVDTVGKLFNNDSNDEKNIHSVLRGIHLEGPVVLDCGGLPCSPSSFRPSDDETARDAFEQLLSLFPPGVVKIMTIAPTYCEKYSYLLEKLKAHDIVVALGHDRNNNVDLVQLLKKQSPSWRFHLTHAFNVMPAPHHRKFTLGNLALMERFISNDHDSSPSTSNNSKQSKNHSSDENDYDEEILMPTVEVIGDEHHVASHLLQTILASKQTGLCFVTDSVLHATTTEPRLSYGREIRVDHERGYAVTTQPDGSTVIAGSACSMFDMFRRLHSKYGVGLARLADMFARVPARVAKINQTVGSIAVGKRADFVLLDEDKITLIDVIVGGKSVKNQ